MQVLLQAPLHATQHGNEQLSKGTVSQQSTGSLLGKVL